MSTDPLADLEPAHVWRYFSQLARIPRPSGGEAEAAAWVVAEARALGCEVEQDDVGNVLIRAKGTPGLEDHPVVAMQGHVDMVCEKNEGTVHDFHRDPIRLRRDGDRVSATGTTLGADDGIGVACALAVIADPSVAHPPLEILVTVDEESGLTGANALAPGWLTAKRLLNLDSEEEGELTIGCAGGVDTTARRALTFVAPPEGAIPVRIKVSGLKGGHSGGDIHLGRANALRLLGQALDVVTRVHGAALASVAGGNKRNAIAREAHAVVWSRPDRLDALVSDVERIATEARDAFGSFDPGIAITVDLSSPCLALAPVDAQAIVSLLLAGPHGIESMSPAIPGLVQTSTNMGTATQVGDAVEINFLTRSSIDSSKRALAARVASVAATCGFTSSESGDYPGWKPEPGAAVVELVDTVHRELFGKPMVIKAIHAGLECGLFSEKYPGMEMASIGPSVWDAHTPDEHTSVRSVQAFWQLLTAVLARM